MSRRPLAGLSLYVAGYFVILELMLVAAVLYWPQFADNVENLYDAAPIPVLKDLLGELEIAGVVGYVVGQHFFKGCNTLGTAAAVLFAAGAVAGEVHRGTFEIWIARPFTRARLLLGRYASGAAAALVPVLVSTLTIPWLCGFVDERIEYAPMLLCVVHQGALLLAIYSLTFLLSAMGSNPTRIAMVVLFVTTFEFALYMIERVTHWSLFRLSDIDDYMRIYDERTLDWKIVLPLLAFSAVTYLGALRAFRRRVP